MGTHLGVKFEHCGEYNGIGALDGVEDETGERRRRAEARAVADELRRPEAAAVKVAADDLSMELFEVVEIAYFLGYGDQM